ncbi:recombinase family protein [Rhizobium sp. FY34]|uniref:recombinase family protein n=1 Tax=Rhizobium sp. FY34 TaxID=2562309 RepID=UPI002484B003|nr:recombinase family protein [Rhizobium sp. FY34]
MVKIGYARVSTDDQKLDLQVQALTKARCDHIFTDHGISGCISERPGLDETIKTLRSGDTLVVWRLDRLGRSLTHLVSFMEELGKHEIHFQSLTEHIDTSTSGGRLIFHIIAALSEFERALISERTKAGMAAARQNGVKLGRPSSLSKDEMREACLAVNRKGEHPHDVAKRYGLAPRSLMRILKKNDI